MKLSQQKRIAEGLVRRLFQLHQNTSTQISVEEMDWIVHAKYVLLTRKRILERRQRKGRRRMSEKRYGVWDKDMVVQGKVPRWIKVVTIKYDPGTKKGRAIGQIIDGLRRLLQ